MVGEETENGNVRARAVETTVRRRAVSGKMTEVDSIVLVGEVVCQVHTIRAALLPKVVVSAGGYFWYGFSVHFRLACKLVLCAH